MVYPASLLSAWTRAHKSMMRSHSYYFKSLIRLQNQQILFKTQKNVKFKLKKSQSNSQSNLMLKLYLLAWEVNLEMSNQFQTMTHSVLPNIQAILKMYLPTQTKLKIISRIYGWIQTQMPSIIILIKTKTSSICNNSNNAIHFTQKIIATNFNRTGCTCNKLKSKK